MDRGAWRATIHGGHKKVRHDSATKHAHTDTETVRKDIHTYIYIYDTYTHMCTREPAWCLYFSVAQSCSAVCEPVDCSTPGLPVHHQLPESTQTHVHGVGDAIQPSHPLSSPSPPAFNHSKHQGLFQWLSSHIMWPKDWSFSFSISPSSDHSGLLSFKMDWLDLCIVLAANPEIFLFQQQWPHKDPCEPAACRCSFS